MGFWARYLALAHWSFGWSVPSSRDHLPLRLLSRSRMRNKAANGGTFSPSLQFPGYRPQQAATARLRSRVDRPRGREASQRVEEVGVTVGVLSVVCLMLLLLRHDESFSFLFFFLFTLSLSFNYESMYDEGNKGRPFTTISRCMMSMYIPAAGWGRHGLQGKSRKGMPARDMTRL